MAAQLSPLRPLFVSPGDAAKLAGVSRSRIYELINVGFLTRHKDGARTLIRVAQVVAWLDSLPVDSPDGRRTDPLLPTDQQKLAIERAREPSPRGRQRRGSRKPKSEAGVGKKKVRGQGRASAVAVPKPQRAPQSPEPNPEPEPAPELKPAPDYAHIYAERLKLLVRDARPDPRLRALEHAVDVCRRHSGCSLEDAKQRVVAALKRSGAS